MAARPPDALGVVLSGTGSEGTAGIRYIREAGGITAAQSPAEAEFDGMPASAIATGLVDLVHVLWVSLLFGLMLHLLFFFFRDGERISAGVARVVPLSADRRHRLLRKLAEVSRATVKGSLIVAGAQGGLGVVLFSIAGIETPVFWGVVMAVLSLVPAGGASLVWLTILVLVSTLGDIAVFGLAGFIAGPVIAALFLVLWELFGEEYAPTPHGPPISGSDRSDQKQAV